MKQLSPARPAIVILAIVAIAMSGVSLLVLATVPMAKLHSESDRAMVLEPVGTRLMVNVTLPAQSSVTFHWSMYGFAPNMSIATVDVYGNTIYGQTVNLSGSASGSGSFVSESGPYVFEFGGLTYAVTEVSLVVAYSYLTQAPLNY